MEDFFLFIIGKCLNYDRIKEQMFESIINDIKQSFSHGNMVTKLLIINVGVFVVTSLVKAFTIQSGFYPSFLSYLAIGGEFPSFIFKPWTFVTHMFVHGGFWHLLWNLIGLMIFGRIVGDLIGDKKVLPIYLMGGIAGAIMFILAFQFAPNVNGTIAIGASAAVLSIAVVAAMVAPDYNIPLILLGNVRLKYIVLAFIFFDIIGSQGTANAGGHFGHFGGIILGFVYIYLLRQGTDLAKLFSFNNLGNSNPYPSYSKGRSKAKVIQMKQAPLVKAQKKIKDSIDPEDKLNNILDKIKSKGYEKLTQDEKDFLNEASNQD